MDAWEDISGPHFEGEEHRAIWRSFSGQFSFFPGIASMPAIDEPSPSFTYFINGIYDQSDYAAVIADLNARMLTAFRRCVLPDGWLYALDWQHPSYRFRPHVPFDATDEWAWRVSVPPNGDYYIFLAEDLRFGIFGHPWEGSMCVYGAELLAVLNEGQPLLFNTILRENGRQLRPLVRAKFTFETERAHDLSVVGASGMRVSELLDQLEANGYDFEIGHGSFSGAIATEDID